MNLRDWYAARSVGARVAIGLTVLFMVLRIAGLGLSALEDDEQPEGPPSSSFATTPKGFAATASLLEGEGVETIRLRRRLDRSSIDPTGTVVIVDTELTAQETNRMRVHLDAGGRVVAIGERPMSEAEDLIDGRLRVQPSDKLARPTGTSDIVSGLKRVSTGGLALGSAKEVEPTLVTERATFAGRTAVGSGELVVVASSHPLQNANLADHDNALFAINVLHTDGPLYFAEAGHGFESKGFNAIPQNVRTALLLLLAAGFAFVWSTGKRLGPPEPPEVLDTPPRVQYINSISETLSRSPDVTSIGDDLARITRRAAVRRLGLRGQVTDDELRRAAAALGLSTDDLSLGIRPARARNELVTAGRSAAELQRRAND